MKNFGIKAISIIGFFTILSCGSLDDQQNTSSTKQSLEKKNLKKLIESLEYKRLELIDGTNCANWFDIKPFEDANLSIHFVEVQSDRSLFLRNNTYGAGSVNFINIEKTYSIKDTDHDPLFGIPFPAIRRYRVDYEYDRSTNKHILLDKSCYGTFTCSPKSVRKIMEINADLKEVRIQSESGRIETGPHYGYDCRYAVK